MYSARRFIRCPLQAAYRFYRGIVQDAALWVNS